MSPEAKAALVPDVAQRLRLDTAHSTRTALLDQIEANRSSTSSALNKDYMDLLSANKTERRELTKSILDARRDKDLAKLNYDAARGKASLKDALAENARAKIGNRTSAAREAKGKARDTTLRSIAGSMLGESAGYLMSSGLGMPETAAHAISLAAGAAPIAKDLVKILLQNPEVLQGVLTGGAVGHEAVQARKSPGAE
jgi:hypothetical protein